MENIKLSCRDKLRHHHGPISYLQVFLLRHRQTPHRQRLILAIGINTSLLATFSCLLIGNHHYRQLSCRPVTIALSCRSTLYRSWVRVQKLCQQVLSLGMMILLPRDFKLSMVLKLKCPSKSN